MKKSLDRYNGITTNESHELFISLTNNGVVVREPYPDDNTYVAHHELINQGKEIDDSKCAEIIGERILKYLYDNERREDVIDEFGYIVKLSDFRLTIEIQSRKRCGWADFWRRLW